ncbi:MAG TPA: hypothetical protein PKA41_18465, partial [Verrucomicrobiota bacterium]|nr:hypothetical protein [Verrucomicrobiota bacterium]
ISIPRRLPPDVLPLVPNGALWQSLETPQPPPQDWNSFFHDDSPANGWLTGRAEIGYGDAVDSRPETTVIGELPRPVTTYFRHTFLVSDPVIFTGLQLRLLRDDGAVVYLNGIEVFRSNLNPTNEILHDTLAEEPDFDDGQTFIDVELVPMNLIPGPNVIAVEVHQDSDAPDDMSFDLMLLGQLGTIPPADCNNNGLFDYEDIANGTSLDSNGNGVPDECETTFRLRQATFVDANGDVLQSFSDYGLLEIAAIQPQPKNIAWANILYEGEWVVQNLPLLNQNGIPTPAGYNVSFSLGNVIGVPVTSAQLHWSITPHPLVSAPLPLLTTLLTVTEKKVYPSTTPGTNNTPAVPHVPTPAVNFTNAASTNVNQVVRRGVPTVSEEVNHCGPGAGARCLGWLNSEYKLGLTNAQSIYDTLKGTNHMKTTSTNGTIYDNVAEGMKKYAGEQGLSNKLTVTRRYTESPDDLYKNLKAGQDVIMLMGWYRRVFTTNMGVVSTNWVRDGGHIVTATGGTKPTNGEPTIDFKDDAFGEDDQGDGKADTGKNKTSTFRLWPGTTNVWIMEGFGSWSVFEGFITVCPDPVTQARTVQDNVKPVPPKEGIKERIKRYFDGMLPTPTELRELLGWTLALQSDTGFLHENLELNSLQHTVKYIVADLQSDWSRRLLCLTLDYCRTQDAALLPEMLDLANKTDQSSTLIVDCLEKPELCESPALPTISIEFTNGVVWVNWPAGSELVSVTTLGDEWLPVPGAVSPHPVSPGGGSQFFRATRDDGCLYGVKSLISGEIPLADFI